jgi:hypothetical protein
MMKHFAITSEPVKQFKISAIVVGLAVLFIVALTFVLGPSNTDTDTDALERQALVAEGKSITAEMEQANRNHDWSRVTEIRERDAAFKRRASDYLARHGQTPPP